VAREIDRYGIGRCLDPDRPELWRAAIASLIAAPDRLSGMGTRARAVSDARYHASHALAAWSATVADAARGSAGPERDGTHRAARNAVGVIAQAKAWAAAASAAASRLLTGNNGPERSDPESAKPSAQAPHRGVPGAIAEGVRRLRPHAIFLGLTAAVAALALYPHLGLAELQPLKDATDPLSHVAAFAVLTLIGALAWGVSLPLIAGLSGLAVALELAQSVTPGRVPDAGQAAAGLAGIMLGLLLARAWLKRRQAE